MCNKVTKIILRDAFCRARRQKYRISYFLVFLQSALCSEIHELESISSRSRGQNVPRTIGIATLRGNLSYPVNA